MIETISVVAFFMIHSNRSKDAFLALIENWSGVLISDNYGVYVNWVNKRQTCLAHPTRKAKALTQRKSESMRTFGQCVLKELRLLCHWAEKPPNE
jgi:transposase